MAYGVYLLHFRKTYKEFRENLFCPCRLIEYPISQHSLAYGIVSGFHSDVLFDINSTYSCGTFLYPILRKFVAFYIFTILKGIVLNVIYKHEPMVYKAFEQMYDKSRSFVPFM